jgi:hypothetical protein
MDGRTSWRTNVCWGHGNGWGWGMNAEHWRTWLKNGRTDERAEGRTFVEATVMDEDDSLLRRWMKNTDEDRLCG